MPGLEEDRRSLGSVSLNLCQCQVSLDGSSIDVDHVVRDKMMLSIGRRQLGDILRGVE